MSNRDLIALVLANLNRMRARVSLTAIGVVIGTAAVVLLVSLTVGLQESLNESMGQFGDLTIIEVGRPQSASAQGMGGTARERDVKLDDRAIDAIRDMPYVVAASPRANAVFPIELKLGRETAPFAYVRGLDPDVAPDFGWAMESGLARLGGGLIVVGKRVFEAGGEVVFMPGGGAIGAPGQGEGELDLQGRTIIAAITRLDDEGNELTRNERLRVAGVLEESGGFNDMVVYMARADVEKLNQWFTGERANPRDGYDEAAVKVDDPAHVREVQAAIDDMGFVTYSSQQIADQLGGFFLIVRVVLGGVGAIALVVAAFGIANTMTMAIYERTKEIGIMKAIGATNRDVLRIFLAEAGAIGAIGGLLGVLLGFFGGKAINYALLAIVTQSNPGAPPEDPVDLLVTPLWLSAFALAFATLIGLASGVYPALRAASMKPLRALRTD
ncbi:MAG: ABC transporter permease [Anaerolineae bacterium]